MNSDIHVHTDTYEIDGVKVEIQRSERLGEQCEVATLPGGLTVVLVPKQMTVTYAMLVVRFGARDVAFDVNGVAHTVPDGVAHFLEHKMFALPDGSDANEHFSALGADANAYTDYDKTTFLFHTTESPLPALRILLDLVFQPHFTKENVAHEQGIIHEEILMDEDDPWQKLNEQTMRALYLRHPLRRQVCGTVSSVATITDETLYECYRAFYRPENMHVIVCGNLTMRQILAVVKEALAAHSLDERASATVERRDYEEPATVKQNIVEQHARVSQFMFQIAVKDTNLPAEPVARLRREMAMNLLSEILFSRAAKFYNELFEKGQITTSYSYGYSTTAGAAYHALAGETSNPKALWNMYWKVLSDARRDGLSSEDFERCRKVLYAGYVSEFDSPEDIADLACEAMDNGYCIFDTLMVIGEITQQEVEALLQDCFNQESTVFSFLIPLPNETRMEDDGDVE